MVIAQCRFLFIYKVFSGIFTCYFILPLASFFSYTIKLKYFGKSRGTFDWTNVSSRVTKVFFPTVCLHIIATLIHRLASEESFRNKKCRLIDFHSVLLRHSSPRSKLWNIRFNLCIYRRKLPSSWSRWHSNYFNRHLLADWRYGESFISCHKIF